MDAATLDLIQVPEWTELAWLRHGFVGRGGGFSTVYGAEDLNLGFTRDDDPRRVEANRERLVMTVAGSEAPPLIAVRQVHGTEILTVGLDGERWTDAAGRGVREADGLVTAQTGCLLAVQAADCVPVLLVDPVRRAVGAFHAGWRGTAGGMVGKGVARMVADFGSRPADLLGAIGPCIRACCYTVGEEVQSQFVAAFPDGKELFSGERDGLHLDLVDSNRRQLEAAGLCRGNVTVVGGCTSCARIDGRRRFFSHRAEQGFTGRAMGVIGMSDLASGGEHVF